MTATGNVQTEPEIARLRNRMSPGALGRTRLPGVLLILVLLGVWEAAARLNWVDSPSFPAMTTVMAALWTLVIEGELLAVLGQSLRRMFLGYALATVAGIAVGLLMGRVRFVFNLLEPIVELVRPVPSPVYIPIVILFLGIGDGMKVFLVFLAAFFPILINTYAGVVSVNSTLIDTARTFGLKPLETIRSVVLPATAPYIFAGLRISLAIALILTIIAEMVAGNDGAGHFILARQQAFRIADMYAGVIALAVLGYLLNRLFVVAEGRLIGWHKNSTASQ